MSTVAMLSGAMSFGLYVMGRPLTISRGDASITATGFIRPGGVSRLTGSAQTDDATFTFHADSILSSPLGELRKFDRITDGGRIYVVQDARVLKEGATPSLIKGTCTHA